MLLWLCSIRANTKAFRNIKHMAHLNSAKTGGVLSHSDLVTLFDLDNTE